MKIPDYCIIVWLLAFIYKYKINPLSNFVPSILLLHFSNNPFSVVVSLGLQYVHTHTHTLYISVCLFTYFWCIPLYILSGGWWNLRCVSCKQRISRCSFELYQNDLKRSLFSLWAK